MDSIEILLSMAYTHAIDMHGVQLSNTHRLAQSPTRHFDPPSDVRSVNSFKNHTQTSEFMNQNKTYSLVPFYYVKKDNESEYELVKPNS